MIRDRSDGVDQMVKTVSVAYLVLKGNLVRREILVLPVNKDLRVQLAKKEQLVMTV